MLLASTTPKELSFDSKHYEPVGERSLGMWFEDVALNNVVLLLGEVEKNNNIQVTETAIDRVLRNSAFIVLR